MIFFLFFPSHFLVLFHVPGNALVLLLANVGRHLAGDLAARVEGELKGVGHVSLDRGHGGVVGGGPDPYVGGGGAGVLKLARAELTEVGVADEREDDVVGKAVLEGGLCADGLGGGDEDAGVMGSDNVFDEGGYFVDVGEGSDGDDDIVKGAFFCSGGIVQAGDDFWTSKSARLSKRRR